jgi:hypothetical protein
MRGAHCPTGEDRTVGGPMSELDALALAYEVERMLADDIAPT